MQRYSGAGFGFFGFGFFGFGLGTSKAGAAGTRFLRLRDFRPKDDADSEHVTSAVCSFARVMRSCSMSQTLYLFGRVAGNFAEIRY